MTKFKVLKKIFRSGSPIEPQGGMYISEEIVEAHGFETTNQCLDFFTKEDDIIKTFASGVWLEIEPVKEEKQE